MKTRAQRAKVSVLTLGLTILATVIFAKEAASSPALQMGNLLFEDDFSDPTSGWQVDDRPCFDHYLNDGSQSGVWDVDLYIPVKK